MGKLELLSPAKNADIGIAAIDCGADAVYIAGPSFGAREAAGNSFDEIARLTSYADRFGVKVFLTLNTILYDHELEEARRHIVEAWNIGCSAVIIQDLGILNMEQPPIPLHASTQCDIRTPEQARFLASLGFERLILARELSVGQIREIASSVDCEIESFVHGALCVSYSGQCYLSQYLTGRSANRGCCTQACRSRYDLVDGNGNILRKDAPLLSLKDLSMKDHLQEMAEAGVCSFKIEGRLKNVSYVRNVVRAYRDALDKVIAGSNGQCEKASSGSIYKGFSPDINATFNRGYTDHFIDGRRKQLNSGQFAKSVGEYVGTVGGILSSGKSGITFKLNPAAKSTKLSNGDGLCFVSANGTVTGLRADTAAGNTISCRTGAEKAFVPGTAVYRNFNRLFEKELENNLPERLIGVHAGISEAPAGPTDDSHAGVRNRYHLTATDEDGNTAVIHFTAETAKNTDTALRGLKEGFSKKAGIYLFSFNETACEAVPFLPASVLNTMRKDAAEKLDALRKPAERPTDTGIPFDRLDKSTLIAPSRQKQLNCANRLSRKLYSSLGIDPEPAYELLPSKDTELMRCKYCIRHELGLCPKLKKGEKATPLYLVNNGKRLKLTFDCAHCEMTVSEAQ